MRRETKIDCLIFSLVVVFGFSGYWARTRLDAQFQDIVSKNEKVQNGPIESIFLDIIREQQGEREAIEKAAEEKKKADKKPAPKKKKKKPRKKKPKKKKPPPKKAPPKKAEEELKKEAAKKPKAIDGL